MTLRVTKPFEVSALLSEDPDQALMLPAGTLIETVPNSVQEGSVLIMVMSEYQVQESVLGACTGPAS